ncbi:MFS general substrate transporter [Pyrrhoderma noxium]|uniref:MFS general substrate transporter n=1 Tax=Pyrrhoderma noxium TaxID=2282107 RepID=A0A286UD77_9AGAM|nr:MFS general substrate transporter [Pyrrhoderma noxium]
MTRSGEYSCSSLTAKADAHTSYVDESKVVRKLDISLIPIVTLFYFLSFLDRANIGNARVAGLQKDLKLTDDQYQICITALYVPYIVSELPANLLLRKIGPNILMPTILIFWGLVTALQGTISSYGGLVTTRVLLGTLEGPMFPSIVLYLSEFYTRRELSLRISLFFSAASLSGAFSGLLAAAIEKMDGIHGRPGWAWIFILEGAFTALVGISGYFLIPSSIENIKLLTKDEISLAKERIISDRPSMLGSEAFSFRQVISSITSPHVIMMFCACFASGTTVYGLALFLPTIVSKLGFSSIHTQLLSVGPFASGFVFTLFVSYFSDKYQNRTIPICLCAVIAAIGYIVFFVSNSVAMSYGSLFLSVSGAYALAPVTSAWIANNSEPHYRRATSIALAFMATNSGGILSTWSFPSSESPRFVRATIIGITFSLLILCLSVLNALYLTWRNHQKLTYKESIRRSDISSGDNETSRSWLLLGDKHSDFLYTI